jgi:hypothetical protein
MIRSYSPCITYTNQCCHYIYIEHKQHCGGSRPNCLPGLYELMHWQGIGVIAGFYNRDWVARTCEETKHQLTHMIRAADCMSQCTGGTSVSLQDSTAGIERHVHVRKRPKNSPISTSRTTPSAGARCARPSRTAASSVLMCSRASSCRTGSGIKPFRCACSLALSSSALTVMRR